MDDEKYIVNGINERQEKVFSTGLKFEKLLVWQKAIDISSKVHQLTLGFPKEELYVLVSQMKRAADSISLNIAEGSQGQSDPETSRFLSYALRSACEVVNCLHIAASRGLIDENQFKDLSALLVEEIRMIQSFRRSISPKNDLAKEQEIKYETENNYDGIYVR